MNQNNSQNTNCKKFSYHNKNQENSYFLDLNRNTKVLINGEQRLNILNKNICIFNKINNLFIKEFKKNLSNYLEVKNLNLVYKNKTVTSYAEYYENNCKNLQFNFSKMASSNNCALISFSPNFIVLVIDLLFGGNGVYSIDLIEKRKFTNNEINILKKIYVLAMKSYCKVWKNEFFFDINKISEKTDFINSQVKVLPNNIQLVVYNFEFIFNKIKLSEFNIAISVLMIEKIIKHIVKNNNKKILTMQLNERKKTFLDEIKNVDINIKVKFKNYYLSISEINTLKIGDILPIENLEQLEAFTYGKLLFSGRYGLLKGKHVISIEKIINLNIN